MFKVFSLHQLLILYFVNYKKMSTGKVKFFNEEKGYGFVIEDETNNEYFVHITEVTNADVLKEGESIEFEVAESEKGKNAVNVTVV